MITTNSVAPIICHPNFAFWSGVSVSLIQFGAVAKVAVFLYLKVFYAMRSPFIRLGALKCTPNSQCSVSFN